MLTERELAGLERKLRTCLTSPPVRVGPMSLVEIVDEAELWPVPFEALVPIAPKMSFERIVETAPAVVCAVASEIGFRFQGIGTVFWAGFEAAFGLEVTGHQRHMVKQCFEDLEQTYGLCRPTESAFSEHFSIMSWPLAHALLPLDVVAPVARLLAHGPAAGLQARNRTPDFEGMRAWATAVEGARLVDWLRIEGPAARVMVALMTENRDGSLSPVSFERIEKRVKSQKEAYQAVRAARSRPLTARTLAQSETMPGRLTLSLEQGRTGIFVTWTPLPPPLLTTARAEARAAGWRPRLWGAGSALHPDTALSPGPMRIALEDLPTGDEPPYPDADAVFGSGSDVAQALAKRNVAWDAILVFEPDHARSQAEQRFEPINIQTGAIWLAASREAVVPPGLLQLAVICGYRILEADLASMGDRQILAELGLLDEEPGLLVARHPIDAITLPRRTASAARAFLVYHGCPADGPQGEVRRLRPGSHELSLRGASGTANLEVMLNATLVTPPAIDILLLQRDRAFDALLARHLQIRIKSRLPLTDVPCRAAVEIDGLIVASSAETFAALPITVSGASRLLKPLYGDAVRDRLLASGRGTLTLSIGRSSSLHVPLERPAAVVDWQGTIPTLVGEAESVGLVEATAVRPHRFERVASISTPVRGATISGMMLQGDRLGHPLLVQTSTSFDLGDLSARFGDDEGSRLTFDNGRGIAELARAKVAWARAQCDSLAAVGARTRVVRQFDAVLSLSLCGREWQRLEGSGARLPTDPHIALWQVAVERQLVTLPTGATDSEEAIFLDAFAAHVRRLDPEWPTPGVDPIEGAMDDALNATFADALERLHPLGRLTEHGADDFDFGSPSDLWADAARDAVRHVERDDLVALLAPSAGARALRERSYTGAAVPDLAEDLAEWTRAFALPRGRLTIETAVLALQLWLSPGACADPDGAILVMARDPFVSRAVRYAALRLASFLY